MFRIVALGVLVIHRIHCKDGDDPEHLHDPPFLKYIPHLWPGGGECGARTEPGIFYDGNDLAWRNEVATAAECAKQCADEPQCHGWGHFAPAKRCYLKSSLTGPMVEFPGTESGPKPCKSNSPSKKTMRGMKQTVDDQKEKKGKEIPGTTHGCLYRDKRFASGVYLFKAGQKGPSGEPVLAGGLIKVKSADDCAKACSLAEDCDAFSFAYFQSNPTKDCHLFKDGGLSKGYGGNFMSGYCPKKQGKKKEGQEEDDAYEYVNPGEADLVCDTLCKLVEGCTSWKFRIARNRNNCKLNFATN